METAEDKNDLNDILIKNDEKNSDNNMKNILLFAAITLLIFFIGVLAFKLVGDNEQINEKKTILPKEPVSAKDDIFEELPTQEDNAKDAKDNLDDMIKRIKESKEKEDKTLDSEVIIEEKADINIPDVQKPKKEVAQSVVPKPQPKKEPAKNVIKDKAFYIQVASLSKYEPNKIFLNKI